MHIKRIHYTTKLMINNTNNFSSFAFHKKIKKDGIVLVTHEAVRLGASLLLLNIAKTLVAQGEQVYIISLNFGELINEYNVIAPTQICLTRTALNLTLKKLALEYGYSRILVNTVISAKCVPIAKKWGYKVVSLIHELGYVVQVLNAEKEAKIMIEDSDATVFSTSIAKREVFNITNPLKGYCVIRPQGIYLRKPDDETIRNNRERFLCKYPSWINKQLVVGVGNTTYRKGFDIFWEVAEQYPDICFLWAGTKERYYDEVLKRKNNHIPENFFYLGRLQPDELSSIYSMTSLMLVSARHDTLPSTIFEALLFKIPVIGSKESGGIVDVINDDIGLLTEKTDSVEFVQAIKFMLKENKIKKIRSNIENLDITKYSFDDYVIFLKNLFLNQ